MIDKLENMMEQHDRLYRIAYKEYLNNDLIAAQRFAAEALDIAQQFRRQTVGLAEPHVFSCRAKTLLEAIEWRSLLVQDK